MKFEDSINAMCQILMQRSDSSEGLKALLNEIGVESTYQVLDEYRQFFQKKPDFFKIVDYPKSDARITLRKQGADYFQKYGTLLAPDERLKKLQIEDLETRLKVLEQQIDEQSEFHRTSSEKNREQIPVLKQTRYLAWVAIIISLISLFISLKLP